MCLAIIKITTLSVRKRLPKKLLKSLSGLFSAAELSDRTGDVIANIPLYKLFQWQATHRTKATQARCINYRVFQTVLHFTNDLKTLYANFDFVVKTQKYRRKCGNKFYLRNLGPVVAFSVLSRLNSSPFYTVLTLFGCLVLFSYVNRSKVGYCVQS